MEKSKISTMTAWQYHINYNRCWLALITIVMMMCHLNIAAQIDDNLWDKQEKNLYQIQQSLQQLPDLKRRWNPIKKTDFVSFATLSSKLNDFNLTFSGKRPKAFFCRWEWELESRIAVPLRFRLGNVQYVDFLEQKSDFYPWKK